MSSSVVHIGRCLGCDEVRRLDDRVCQPCLARSGGRRFAEQCHRVRTDPAFAAALYQRLPTARARERFVALFGLPTIERPRIAVNDTRPSGRTRRDFDFEEVLLPPPPGEDGPAPMFHLPFID